MTSRINRTEETLAAAATAIIAEGIAVGLLFACVFVWLVILKTGGLS